jgi:hypothetical protein
MFFMMWHSDGLEVQEQLAERMAKIIFMLKNDKSKMNFIQGYNSNPCGKKDQFFVHLNFAEKCAAKLKAESEASRQNISTIEFRFPLLALLYFR